MSIYKSDTIIAQATPPGRGSVGILRISGPQVIKVANLFLGKLPKPRYADYLPFYDNKRKILDHGIALYFPSPNSFTGEDVLELQGHGGPLIMDLLLKQILKIDGVRIANPGEFSERAFLNDKIDLAQAEAIADLINASSEQAARSAIKSLQGVFSQQIYKIVNAIINLRTYIEAEINFPNEEINVLSENKIKTKLSAVIASLDGIRSQAYQGSLLREGIKVVIAGLPNAGKSSLLNALSGRNSAIVTNIPGTTRDVLHEHIHIDGMPLHIIDTAGLRETTDKVENIGINRAWKEISQADHVLFIVDSIITQDTHPEEIFPKMMKQLPQSLPITIIRNKVDITNEPITIKKMDNYSILYLSVYRKEGIELLRKHLKKSIRLNNYVEGSFLARRRHIQSLNIAADHLQNGYQQLIVDGSYDLLAEELSLTQEELSKITGEFRSNDLLDSIFSSFCIGK